MKYKVGDKFISLVSYRGLTYGDLLTIKRIFPRDPRTPIHCASDAWPKTTSPWGFSEKSLEFATIPLTSLSDKELFVYTLSGKPPREELNLSTRDEQLIYGGR